MEHDVSETITALHDAATTWKRARVTELTEVLTEHLRRARTTIAAEPAVALLARLRRQRFFPQMQRLADVMIQTGQRAPQIRRQHAQALIEQGAFTAAAAVLRALESETADDPIEQGEARGLLGRVLKQQYVSAGHPRVASLHDALRDAIRWYLSGYDLAPERNGWHGINAVACIARARRDGVVVDYDERQLAETIRARLAPSLASVGPIEPFIVATMLEAAVALGDWADAMELAQRYAKDEEADAFSIGSTVRQLSQVWELDGAGDTPARILDTLRTALLRRHQGAVELSAGQLMASVSRYERNFSGARYLTHDWYAAGLARARLVVRIGSRYQRGLGSGFVMRGGDLSDALSGRWIVLTNAHVVSDDDRYLGSIRPSRAFVEFEAPAPTAVARSPYRVRRALWTSGPTQLDTTVLELDDPVPEFADAHAYDVADRLPTVGHSDRIYIIGHPVGGTLSFSLQDNLLLGSRGHLLHYRTPTEQGSSGSPLFDDDWNLVGIHHKGLDEMPGLDGSGVYEANEGISIHAIREAIAADGIAPDC